VETLDRQLKAQVDKLVKDARTDQIKRLLRDIGRSERVSPPQPTHRATERLQ